MKILQHFLLLSALIGIGSQALGADAECESLPWRFGMSQEQVRSVSACGPYKSFSNGDLETYRGVFAGRERNFQFFFSDGRLRRIGVYTYEGEDAEAAVRAYLQLYKEVSSLFGKVETPGYTGPDLIGPNGETTFLSSVSKLLASSGKVQMAPYSQPKEAFVFSSVMRREIERKTHYYVVLYFNERT